jgi:hypothetical protein
MAQARKSIVTRPARTPAQMGEAMQVDYSWNEWRYAQMQQLERNYSALMEREGQMQSDAEAAFAQ